MDGNALRTGELKTGGLPARPLVLGVVACVLMIGLISFISGCGGDGGGGLTGPQTAEEYSDRGWKRFREGKLADALEDFDDAIGMDAAYAPALAGQGWARMGLATSVSAMESAVSSFDACTGHGGSEAYVYAGRAAARLGVGGSSLTSAITDAQAALAADANFVFEHRASFNKYDLRLIVAFSYAEQGEFTDALAAADEVADSGIESGNPSTWKVDGVTYESLETAIIAYLEKLSDGYSG